MRNYTYTTKEIKMEGRNRPYQIKSDNGLFIAHFPKTHSTVKGIIYQFARWDNNAGDSWANISDMREYIVLYILWKGHSEWEEIVDGADNKSGYQLAYYHCGSRYTYNLEEVLFKLETKRIQRKFELKVRRKELKEEIKDLQKELKEVEKNLLCA